MSSWHGGKGSKQRPTDKQKFADNWDKIFGKKDIDMGLGFNDGFAFWEHDCPVQKDIMGFEKGTPCDWCGATENDTFRETEIQELPIDGK